MPSVAVSPLWEKASVLSQLHSQACSGGRQGCVAANVMEVAMKGAACFCQSDKAEWLLFYEPFDWANTVGIFA